MISIDDLSKINKKIVWTELSRKIACTTHNNISLKTKLDFKKISNI